VCGQRHGRGRGCGGEQRGRGRATRHGDEAGHDKSKESPKETYVTS